MASLHAPFDRVLLHFECQVRHSARQVQTRSLRNNYGCRDIVQRSDNVSYVHCIYAVKCCKHSIDDSENTARLLFTVREQIMFLLTILMG